MKPSRESAVRPSNVKQVQPTRRSPTLVWATHLLVLLFLPHLAAGQVLATTAVGRTTGKFGVSQSGAATYAIPIWTPPGVAGVEPSLGLSYNSQGSGAFVSLGWSVSGFSQITRCQRTTAQDGAPAAVSLSSEDVFCIDGRRLRVTSGIQTYGLPDSTYQTEVADFSLVTAKGLYGPNVGDGPAWFEVKSKAGLIYEYGNSATSRALLSPSSLPHAWALSKVRDRSGNNMVITYAQSSGVLIPIEILYTQTPSTGATYPYSVLFTYSTLDPADRTTGYLAGLPYSANSRLTAIEVRHGGSSGTLLRIYRLTYADSPTTGRSRLATIQECAGASGTDCKAPTTVAYQNGQVGVPTPSIVGPTLSNAVRAMFADLNGDGKTDLLYGVASGANIHWWARLAVPSAGYNVTPFDTGITSGPNDDVLVDDFTGIGHATILAPSNGFWGHWRFIGNFASGSFYATGMNLQIDPNRLLAPNPADGRWPSFASADTTGDGLPDLVWAATYNGVKSIYTRKNTTSEGVLSFSTQMVEAYPIPGPPDNFAGVFGNNSAPNHEIQRIDFNADGRDDVVMGLWRGTTPISGSARQLISQGQVFATGASIQNVLGWPLALNWNDDACTDFKAVQIHVSACNGGTGQTVSVGGGVLIDWDGDGRTDLLAPNGSEWYVQRSMGSSADTPAPTGIPYSAGVTLIPVDHDGDGLIDLVSWDFNTGVIRIGLHRGQFTPPDLLSNITDGFGNTFAPVYRNIRSNGIHERTYAGVPEPTYPDAPYNGALNVVRSFSASDGTGGTYGILLRYYAARKNLHGRGFQGFAARRTHDSRNGLYHYEEYRQDFPVTGIVSGERSLRADDTTLIRSLTNTVSKYVLDGALHTRREFPYVSQSVARSYEVGGPLNGSHVLTRTTSNTVNSWGTLTDQVVTTTEVSTGLNAGAIHSERIYLPAGTVLNDTSNWCLSRPTEVQYINSHSLPGGTSITRTKTQTWDAVNCRLTQEVTQPGDPKWQVSTTFGYDAFGNVNSITQIPAAGQGQGGRTTVVNWGASGQFPREFTNAKSQVTRVDWDVQKAVQTSVTDRNNLVTQWQYDAFGRLTREDRPDGTSTEFVLSACNVANSYCGGANDLRHAVQATPRDTLNAVLRTDTQYFDAFDRLRYEGRQGLTGAISTVITTYDALGRVSSKSEPATAGDPVWYTSFAYDLRNRVLTMQRQTSESDTSTSLTQMSYEGFRIVKTDPLARSSAVHYNAAGQILQTVNAAGSDTDYEYDAFGNLVKVRDVLGNETMATFNVRGMRLSSNDADMGLWTYDYFPLGELKSQTTARNHTTTFTYDDLSRVTTRVEPEGTTTWTWDTATNGVGLLRSVQSPGPYSETYAYDSLGRTVQASIVADGGTYLINQSYNTTTGLLETLTYPTSTSGVRFKLRYGYQYGEIQSVRNYTGDVLSTTYWQAAAANARGQIIDEQLGNGLRTISSYDRIAGWLESRTTGPGGGSARQNLEYTWNKVGQLASRSELNINHTETFFYDALDRLDFSQLDGVTNLDVAYDAIGNITSKSDVGTYTYHATKKHAVVAAGPNTYAYDANGNMITRNGASITWASYDLPTNITQSDGNYSQFLYGANRARYKHVTFSAATGVETTIHIGDLFERVARGTTTEYKHYIKAPGGAVALYNRKSTGINETVYLLKDHLGSIEIIANSTGQQLSRLSNDAFGRRRNGGTWTGVPATSNWTTINDTTHRAFTGHEHLDNLSLIHMNGRVYDRKIGRFLSADPFVQEPYLDQSWNRYSYVLNSPLNYTDPSGHNWDDWLDWDLDWDWDFGWEEWFDDEDDGEYSCSNPGSDFCRRAEWLSALLRECGLSVRCREEFRARNPPPPATHPIPPAPPAPAPPNPEDELPSLPEPDTRPVPGPASGTPGLGGFAGAVAGRLQATVEAATGYHYAEEAAAWLAEAADRTWNGGWPGDGSLEAQLAALPPAIGGSLNRIGAISNIARARALGRAGEAAVRAVYDIGAKARIIVNGRPRVPDGLTGTVVSEIKNRASLGFTRQLRDYAQYALDSGRRFDLYVRPGAKLSPRLLDARDAGLVNIIEIPF